MRYTPITKSLTRSEEDGITRIHHVSILTGMAERNYQFYTQILGMRLIKKTVNQDDTTSYHLFYGDAEGNPGTT